MLELNFIKVIYENLKLETKKPHKLIKESNIKDEFSESELEQVFNLIK